MQKKLLAVAVAGALGAPAAALAQSSTVQIYGTMYMEYGLADQGTAGTADGGELQRIDIMQTPGSNIGFKGEEKLGGGLSAWFQCESTADIRGVGQEGWCSRNSALGLKGGFGNVFLGRWDTPFKRAGGPLLVGSNQTGLYGTSFLMVGGSTSTIGASARAAFFRRQSNTFNYDSPTFGGFQVMAAFSSAQAPGTALTTGATNGKPRVLSLGAKYSAGPLYVAAGYQKHDDFFGGGAPAATGGDTTDKGWFVGAAYTWGPVRFGGMYTRQDLEPTTTTEIEVQAWQLGLDWKIVGPHGLRAAYATVDDTDGNAIVGLAGSGSVRPAPLTAAGLDAGDNGAETWSVRYVYTFSKRTEFTFGYSALNNDGAGTYRMGGLGAAVAPGNNEDAWVVALRHRF
jgi:predicted porin